MQTRVLSQIGYRSTLALLWVVAGGGAALGQAPPAGMPGDSGAGTAEVSRFSDMKVSLDFDNRRLVTVIPDLLKSVGAEFTIDAEVKNAVVSSHLTNVKLQSALDVLMRVSDIPVQYTFVKGVYHFSKKVELPPEIPQAPPTRPVLPGDSVLPPPPEVGQSDVDVHNVQTYDLARVLNELFHIPVELVPSEHPSTPGTPTYPADFGGSISGFRNGHGFASDGRSGTTSGGSTVLGGPGGTSGSQSTTGGGTITVFGRPIHFGGPSR